MIEGVDYAAKERGHETACWIWQHYIGPQGYGMKRRDGPPAGAHVLAWEAVNGPVPDGLQLDHLCRVRACVRPSHLEPVTNAENGRRGRATKLTSDLVARIRVRFSERSSDSAIAAEFGVARSTISNIRNGHRWQS